MSPEPTSKKAEAPLSFTTLLQNTEAVVGETVELYCEMTQIGVDVTWLRDNQPLSMVEGRYQIINQDHRYELIIASVTTDDEGEYTVQAGDLQSSAALTVHGQWTDCSDSVASSLQTKTQQNV